MVGKAVNEGNRDVAQTNVTCFARLATITAMWRRLHILGPAHSLMLASVSAALIALPITVQLVSRDQAARFRIPAWPDTLNLYITFSIVLVGVLLVLLGYYHLGRLGFLVSVALASAVVWSMAVCGILSFVWVGHYLGSVWLSTFLYAAFFVLVYLLIAGLHLRAASSSSLHDAQLKLRLIPSRRH
jgi:hypothetical protein